MLVTSTTSVFCDYCPESQAPGETDRKCEERNDLADFYHDLCLAFTNNVGLLDLKKSCDVLPWLEKELWTQSRAIFTFVN